MALPIMKPDRRQSPRTKLGGLVYINFEPNNGGIVLDVCEEGLCFHAVAPIQPGATLSFSLSANGDRIERVGVLAWTDEHRKTGGLRFNDLGPDARRQIRALIEQSARPSAPEKNLAVPVPNSQGRSWRRTNRVPMAESAVSTAFSQRVRAPLRLGDFSRGLAAGLLIALFVAIGYSLDAHRGQLGGFLIRLGERLEVTPPRVAAPNIASTPTPPASSSSTAGTNRHQLALLPTAPATPQASAVTSSTSERPAKSLPLPPAVMAQPHVHSNLASTTPAPAIAAPLALSLPSSATPASTLPPPADSNASQPAPITSLPISNSAQPASPASPAAASSASSVVAKAADQPGENENAEDVVEINSDVPLGKYLDVGRFKDQFAAQQIERNLTDLRFRAVVLPKSVLWMKSYQVLVGPYREAQEAEAARLGLQSDGYKPRSLAKRSRQLTLVASWRNPHDISDRDTDNFIVTWEAYSAQATVNFVTRGKISGTAVGKWVKLAGRSGYSAIVYSAGDPGKRNLLSIQFYGMKQAVMLPHSADRGIVF